MNSNHPGILTKQELANKVLPTHWDRFNVSYDVSQAPAIERLQSFLAEVKAASPRSVVTVPKYFETIEVR